MTLLLTGIALWFVTHLFPIWMAERRKALGASIGEGMVKAGVALLTLGAVALMVTGYQNAPYTAIWTPPTFLVHLNNLLMLLAIFVFIAGRMPSVVRRKIRHPQLAGVKIWALAHLLVNGDLVSIVLFGGLLAWAVLAMIGSNRRDGSRGPLPESSTQGLVAHIGLTLIVFSATIYVHGMLLDVWPLPG